MLYFILLCMTLNIVSTQKRGHLIWLLIRGVVTGASQSGISRAGGEQRPLEGGKALRPRPAGAEGNSHVRGGEHSQLCIKAAVHLEREGPSPGLAFH